MASTGANRLTLKGLLASQHAAHNMLSTAAGMNQYMSPRRRCRPLAIMCNRRLSLPSP